MILEAKDLRKSFGDAHVLRGISLKIGKGESIAIMGASGEGKTTLLHILGTLETHDSGALHILGKEPINAPLIRSQHFGFIFQSHNLLEDFSVLENILMPIRIARKNIKLYLPKAKELLKRVGLSKHENSSAKVLSGGEKQRAAIARALINDPDIILADEPTGNLDNQNSKVIYELLMGLKDLGKSIIIATHDENLSALADRLYTLRDGTLKEMK